MGNLIDLRKIFGKLAAEIFPLGLKKFAPQNLNLMGITGSVCLNNNQFFVKNEKFFHGVKILEKFYKSKNILQGKSK